MFDRVRVVFHWLEPNRRRDPDNTRGGSKFILDGMQPKKDIFWPGIIPNDGWRNIIPPMKDYWYISKDKKSLGVLVEVTEVD